MIPPKHHTAESVFQPEGLLREARRQKGIPEGNVPEICLLDPDGDLARELQESGVEKDPHWACYHTEMFTLERNGVRVGVIGCAVGAPYAVLVAEQLFCSGCRLLVSVTSAGQINELGRTATFILIDRALRDEGTSHHYLSPADFAEITEPMRDLGKRLYRDGVNLIEGAVWTTDAPFRETREAIAHARSNHLLAVEMEAAALYALAQAKSLSILCLAKVTNQMATVPNDFEKGAINGNEDLMHLLHHLTLIWKEEKNENP